jgi:hypothetical protein
MYNMKRSTRKSDIQNLTRAFLTPLFNFYMQQIQDKLKKFLYFQIFLFQLLRGLKYCHTRKILHRYVFNYHVKKPVFGTSLLYAWWRLLEEFIKELNIEIMLNAQL